MRRNSRARGRHRRRCSAAYAGASGGGTVTTFSSGTPSFNARWPGRRDPTSRGGSSAAHEGPPIDVDAPGRGRGEARTATARTVSDAGRDDGHPHLAVQPLVDRGAEDDVGVVG